jgi:hypothetical protein
MLKSELVRVWVEGGWVVGLLFNSVNTDCCTI